MISTLWPVADDDAARFMVLFYAELLKRDDDRIGALRAARLRAIEGRMPSRVWAAFVLFDGHRAE
ncbi:MAG: CHAT domain-containing protein [bacterium]|nr:CHAT domain-containing protein [bacterium]